MREQSHHTYTEFLSSTAMEVCIHKILQTTRPGPSLLPVSQTPLGSLDLVFLIRILKNLQNLMFELVDPNTNAEVRPQISTLNTQATVQQLGSLHFSKFSSWWSLNHAIANLSHISHSYHSHPGRGSNNCSGWHLCREAHPAQQLSKSKCIIIRAVQEEAYSKELVCLRKGVKV